MNPQNEHTEKMRLLQASKATVNQANDNTIAWLMFIGLVFVVWQILFCLYKKNEAYRTRKEQERIEVIKSSLPAPDLEKGVEKKKEAVVVQKKIDYQELDVETENTNMSISESYEFENQLTNRLGKRDFQNEEELKVKQLQDEILRETAMVNEMQKEEQKVEGGVIQEENSDDEKNPDQLSFNSEVEVEETSDEGEPGVFNYDNMAQ